MLPSQYVAGTPLYPDDSLYTVKQKYSSATDTLVPTYYYWVRNTSVLPENSVYNRKNTTSFVANLISNPQGLGTKYFAITDPNKMFVTNVSNLNQSKIILNVDIRTNNFDATAHSVWKLAREGDKDYRPGTTIETRWWDSLIGKNSTGDLVPDLDLPINEKYGNNTTPRQSWYVDIFDALKEIIDYANSILKKNQLTGIINLENLNKLDPEPSVQSLEWDATVDTYAELTYIDTRDLSGSVKYLVKADETSNGFWAIYTWDGTEFSRTKLQSYNTSKYWSYIDWYGTDPDVHEMVHNENTPIDKQVTYEYELDTLDLDIGKHVKVTQGDTGGWKLFMKTSKGFTNVGTQNGTIRLSTKLYDYSQDATGFAGGDNFDDNFFDQEPSIETRNILTALRDDLFINDLALEYNTLFFTGLRKVLSEQTYVDWMFKTSFINVKNSVRKLDQRKTYTTGTDSWIESYINEVKPFHTKVRQYRVNYAKTDTFGSDMTDFDNAAYWNSTEQSFNAPDVNNTAFDTRYTLNPSKIYKDNYKLSVSEIIVADGGSGYTEAPVVSISGGNGSGAKATAYVSNGSIQKITVAQPGTRRGRPGTRPAARAFAQESRRGCPGHHDAS